MIELLGLLVVAAGSAFRFHPLRVVLGRRTRDGGRNLAVQFARIHVCLYRF